MLKKLSSFAFLITNQIIKLVFMLIFYIVCSQIFVPIHKKIHWCLAVINNKDKKFQYLDSLRGYLKFSIWKSGIWLFSFPWMLYGCLVIFEYFKFDTHFGFLLMPKGETNGIKSRIHMSNQLIFKISINSKTKGENGNLCEWSTRKKCVCVCFLISEVVIIKKGEIVEAKLHGE